MFKLGQMVQNMKVNGKIIKLMEKENFGMLMAIYLKVIGRMIKLMDLEYIFMLTVQNMTEIGKMIYKMGMVWKHGPMGQNTKVIIKQGKNTDKVHILGLMVPSM